MLLAVSWVALKKMAPVRNQLYPAAPKSIRSVYTCLGCSTGALTTESACSLLERRGGSDRTSSIDRLGRVLAHGAHLAEASPL